jgi:hypothetical protein
VQPDSENNINSCLLVNLLPIFLDVHKVPFTEDNLKELCQSPPDEFGVSHVNLFYNKESSVCFCLLHAPDLDAVEKHHKKVNIQCEWITEVTNIVNDAFKMNQARH